VSEQLPGGALPEWLYRAVCRGEPAEPPAGMGTAEATRLLVAARRDKLATMRRAAVYVATGKWEGAR